MATNETADEIKGDQLTQTGVVGPAPAIPSEFPIQPVPPMPYTLGADLTQEYTAGFPRNTLAYAETLPQYIDELSETLGADLYAKMMRDSQVAGDVQYLKLAALANGVTLSPCIKEGETNHREAVKARDFCQAALDGMKTELYDVLFSMLDAVCLGHSIGEIVLRRGTTFEFCGPNAMTFDRIKHKLPGVFAFVTDNRRNYIGMMVLVAGQGLASLSPRTIMGPNDVPNLLPRHKFAVLTNQPKGGDPRGRSLLYAAYDPWFAKQQHKFELLKYLCQFGAPSLIGVTGEKAANTPKLNPDGTVTLGANGTPIMLPPAKVLLAALEQFRNGSALAVPFGTTVTHIAAVGNGEAFRLAIALDNMEISKAILSQTLATNEGEHQARAAATSAKDISDLLVDYVERILSNMVESDLLKLILEVNHDLAYANKFCPIVTLSKVEEADFAPYVTAAAAAGYTIDPEQFGDVDAKVGLESRSDEAVQRAIDRAAAPPPAPAIPGEPAIDPKTPAAKTPAKKPAEKVPNA